MAFPYHGEDPVAIPDKANYGFIRGHSSCHVTAYRRVIIKSLSKVSLYVRYPYLREANMKISPMHPTFSFLPAQSRSCMHNLTLRFISPSTHAIACSTRTNHGRGFQYCSRLCFARFCQ
uniref:Uncharacterized protein n=1 Tax=Picea glauca TaxID=3330 RepID=A0A101LY10_PICGL|nr:hypothetical protein ABT39_MTgene5630 [Picea glauca]QHR88079.1 hypothetical protein Q903MT_gene2092 [Picea sitchensis]